MLLALALVVLLGAWLRCYDLGAHSIGNAYYAATVKSMLTSWHNFFFAAYEPGGSVTVDKPPVGFWLQAVSAAILGVNGLALALPQALAGTLSIVLLYALVSRQFGRGAGLVAALALAVTPVAVSTERNNTVDGLLLFVLLLAAWAFWRAARTGRLRHLLLGALLVGVGFNVKMLQAFLPLPAFYLLYLLGAPVRWSKRLAHLALATVVLLAVSLSWAVVVDLTPPQDRPYIGSSQNNTVMELIVGHNGLRRLDVLSFFRGDDTSSGLPGAPSGAPLPQASGQSLPSGPANPSLPPSALPARPGGQSAVPPGSAPPGTLPGGGDLPAPPGGGQSDEVGRPGWLRLVTEPLVGEAGWLLPLALLGLPLVLVVAGRPWPLTPPHLALVLWAGWLLPEVVYFSFNAGLWHAYYLIMLGPPLAALVGATAWATWRWGVRRPWAGVAVLVALAAVTMAVQLNALRPHPAYASAVQAAWLLLLFGGLAFAVWPRRQAQPALARVAWGTAILALLIAPLFWSGLTALNDHPDVALPRSGPGTTWRAVLYDTLAPAQEAILAYLLAHTEPDGYLVAGLSAHDVSGYILATGRPALALGGFTGSDSVVSVDQLAAMVEAGELRYVLGGQALARQKPGIALWVHRTCTPVQVPGAPPPGPGREALYDCARGASRPGRTP